MARLVALSGSLRKGSYNTALAHALAGLAPEGARVDVRTPAGIPLYDGDLETDEGIPEGVAGLKADIAASDGLILVTPEYNQGVPGVLKNAIDWLSRPPADIPRVFSDRPVALAGASAGRGGTRAAQYALLPTLRAFGARAWNGRTLYVGAAGEAVDDDGRLVDQGLRGRCERFVREFVAFCGQGPGGR